MSPSKEAVEAVAVKPLEWVWDDFQSLWKAQTAFGEYQAWGWDATFCWREPGDIIGRSGQRAIEAAKGAAQASYDDRIRAVLAIQPEPATAQVDADVEVDELLTTAYLIGAHAAKQAPAAAVPAGEPEQDAGLVEAIAEVIWFDGYGKYRARHGRPHKWPDDVVGGSQELFRSMASAVVLYLSTRQPAPDAQREVPAVEIGEDAIAWIIEGVGDGRCVTLDEELAIFWDERGKSVTHLVRAHTEQREAVPEPSAKPADVEADDADEAYEIGKRDGYSEALQDLDVLTGGDGEYRVSLVVGGGTDGDRHCPDEAAMKARIVNRFNDRSQPAPAQAETAVPEGPMSVRVWFNKGWLHWVIEHNEQTWFRANYSEALKLAKDVLDHSSAVQDAIRAASPISKGGQ